MNSKSFCESPITARNVHNDPDDPNAIGIKSYAISIRVFPIADQIDQIDQIYPPSVWRADQIDALNV